MTTFSLKYEDRLEGPFNFILWKCRLKILLEEHELWHIVEEVAPPTYSALLAEYNKKTTKAK